MTPKMMGIGILGVAACVESVAQMSLKVGAAGGPRILSSPYKEFACQYRFTALPNAWTLMGILFYGVQIFLWTLVLHLMDVSIAFPMDSLCFVGVALLSTIFLGEAVGPVKWLGIFCILSGIFLLAS